MRLDLRCFWASTSYKQFLCKTASLKLFQQAGSSREDADIYLYVNNSMRTTISLRETTFHFKNRVPHLKIQLAVRVKKRGICECSLFQHKSYQGLHKFTFASTSGETSSSGDHNFPFFSPVDYRQLNIFNS